MRDRHDRPSDTSHPIVVIGGGGFGREVLELIADINSVSEYPLWEVRGVLDDGGVDPTLLNALGTRCLGAVATLRDLGPEVRHVIAIGGCAARASIDERCRSWGRAAATLIHPRAVVGRSTNVIGEGSILCAFSSVTTNVRLGRHTHLNPHSAVAHDSVLGDHVTVTPHAGIAGEVTVGDRVFVGTGATIGPRLAVGSDALIGAGAVAVADVPAGTTVAGVPARPMGRATS